MAGQHTSSSSGAATADRAQQAPGCKGDRVAMRAGHMSEETRNADVSAAWGIVIAIVTSAMVGFGYILALCFAIQVRLRVCRLPPRWGSKQALEDVTPV